MQKGGWRLWLHSLKVAQLLRSAACLHTNQSRSYLNHLVFYVVVCNGKFLKSLEIPLSANISAYKFINILRLLKDAKSKETNETNEGQTVVICVNTLKIISFNRLKGKNHPSRISQFLRQHLFSPFVKLISKF